MVPVLVVASILELYGGVNSDLTPIPYPFSVFFFVCVCVVSRRVISLWWLMGLVFGLVFQECLNSSPFDCI
jgi:uncharacterized membrane protein